MTIPLLYGNDGSLDPIAHIWAMNKHRAISRRFPLPSQLFLVPMSSWKLERQRHSWKSDAKFLNLWNLFPATYPNDQKALISTDVKVYLFSYQHAPCHNVSNQVLRLFNHVQHESNNIQSTKKGSIHNQTETLVNLRCCSGFIHPLNVDFQCTSTKMFWQDLDIYIYIRIYSVWSVRGYHHYWYFSRIRTSSLLYTLRLMSRGWLSIREPLCQHAMGQWVNPNKLDFVPHVLVTSCRGDEAIVSLRLKKSSSSVIWICKSFKLLVAVNGQVHKPCSVIFKDQPLIYIYIHLYVIYL